MNVGLHHRGIDAQLLAVLQSEFDRRLHYKVIDQQAAKDRTEALVRASPIWMGLGSASLRRKGGKVGPVLSAIRLQRARILRGRSARTALGVCLSNYLFREKVQPDPKYDCHAA
jgi:hypothetical protein